jgi:hypothetical protein
MAPASIVFPDPSFLFQTPNENDEYRFQCTMIGFPYLQLGSQLRSICLVLEISGKVTVHEPFHSLSEVGCLPVRCSDWHI